VIRRIHQKLAARFYGPFKIIEKVGEVAYRLQLPDYSKIHPVFHVSLLKKAVGDYDVHGTLPKDLEVNTEDEHYPEKVLGARLTRKDGSVIPQSLIKWRGRTMDDVTWEDNDILRGQFPDFILEDKDVVKEGEIDRGGAISDDVGLDVRTKPKIIRVYSRRNQKGDVAK
jgi:hypothetical protein